jgi:putative endonuclease
VTCNLLQRVWQHKSNVVEGYTQKYQVHVLVWYEVHDSMESAIVREKVLKKWNRIWKLRLIEQFNPEWQDLYYQLT